MLRIVPLFGLLLLLGAGDRPRTVTVTIRNMAFSPASVQINPGDSITWTNTDDRDHNVTARDGSFKSGNIRAGGSFSHRFEKPGNFAYGCGYHPRMKGVISVSE